MPQVSPDSFDIHFPKAGIHRAGPFGKQPSRPAGTQGQFVRTTADAVNCVPFDVIFGRDRGGSRVGLAKFINFPVYGDPIGDFDVWVCQHLNVLTSTVNADMPEQSTSGRLVYLVAVSQGVVKYAFQGDTGFTTPTNNSGEEPALNVTGWMMSSQNNQKLYFCDGINYVYFNPATDSVELWEATAGELPRDSDMNAARLTCTWRGRTVLSGLLKDPQNWFMSKVSDPHDFEYQPDPVTVTQAVAGNNSRLGLIGDVITALIPYTDDLLIFGGDHTIYAMRGDPADGGQIDLISDVTGVAFGEAWCKDPYGNIYFFGSRPSFWRMSGGQPPQRLGQPIEPLLTAINSGTNIIRLVWDDEQQGVWAFITFDAEPTNTNTHFFWDYRTNSWWKIKFANNDHNPLCAVAFDGNLANDRCILIGCWDGHVRFLTPASATDDGTDIASYVLLGPILTQNADEMLLKEIQFIMSEFSGQVTWEVLAGDTAEAALVAAARASGIAVGGRNGTQPVRVANHALYIKISSAGPRWSMEVVRAVFTGLGKVRRRKP